MIYYCCYPPIYPLKHPKWSVLDLKLKLLISQLIIILNQNGSLVYLPGFVPKVLNRLERSASKVF